ncbi:MAG: hypothetical protein WBI18_09475 [Candidatus Saccharicenans sp.]
MKKFIIILIVVAAGYLAYNQFFKISPEEDLVRQLEKEFQTATQNYINANRAASEPGLVAIADPEKAENQVKSVRARLKELIPTLTEEKAITRARELEGKIHYFCEKNDIE